MVSITPMAPEKHLLAPHDRRLALSLLALLLIPILTGCGSSAPLQHDRFYALEPTPSLEASAGSPSPAILLVNHLAARGFLGGRQIVYRTHQQPLVVERYDDLLWEEPVPRAMAQILVNAIRDARLFQFVVIPADRARADYLLGGEVERFEHRPTDQPSRVVATLNLSLVSTNDRHSLWTRRYSGEEMVRSETDGAKPATPDAMAEAFNRLAARLATEVVRDLRTLKQQLQSTQTGS